MCLDIYYYTFQVLCKSTQDRLWKRGEQEEKNYHDNNGISINMLSQTNIIKPTNPKPIRLISVTLETQTHEVTVWLNP